MKHFFIVLVFLLTITLVRGEDNKVTIGLVNGGNSFLQRKDINLKCYFQINGTVNSVTLKFKNEKFYFYDATNKSKDKTDEILKKYEVKEDSTEKDMVKVTIKNATQDLEGEYTCIVGFTDSNNHTTEKDGSETFHYLDEPPKINIRVYETKDNKSTNIQKVREGDPFFVECGVDVGKCDNYIVTLLQENEPFATCNVINPAKGEHNATKLTSTKSKIHDQDFDLIFKDSRLTASFKKASENTKGPFKCEYYFNIDENKKYREVTEVGFTVNSGVLLSFSFSLFTLTLLSNFYSKIY